MYSRRPITKRRNTQKINTSSNRKYNLLLESNITNLSQNLKNDYLNSVELLFEYFASHKKKLSDNDIMKIINALCKRMHLNEIQHIDAFCKILSHLCIQRSDIEWDKETFNHFFRVMHDCFSFDASQTLFSLIPLLPSIIKTIGHILFERGKLINAENRHFVIALLIPLASPKNKNLVPASIRMEFLHENVEKLCIHYGIQKFSYSHNIASFESAQQIYQYIQECNNPKNSVAVNPKIKECWKYSMNLRKLSVIAIGHALKNNDEFISFKHTIFCTVFDTFHFLKNDKVCRNQHDFAKSMIPSIRTMSQLFDQFDFNEEEDAKNAIDEDLTHQIIEDLTDLMVIGADNSNHKVSSTGSDIESDNNRNLILSEYRNICKTDRHRMRNRVLLDWNGEQYRRGNGYTSDQLTAELSENIDKSFFVPFDVCICACLCAIQSLMCAVFRSSASCECMFSIVWVCWLKKTKI